MSEGTPELGQALFGNKWERFDAPDYIADDLYDLSEMLGQMNPENQAHGFFGGEWGYGQDFVNGTFEMFPYWWGDCECGFEELEDQWNEENRHAPDCYQVELERRGGLEFDSDYEERRNIAPTLAKEWGLPYRGCMVHCTCDFHDRYAEWHTENYHDSRCGVVRPNFWHKPSGLRVHWYKYIGRSMTINRSIEQSEWQKIYNECRVSLKDGTRE